MKLSKGANAPVPTSLLAVVISWQSEHVVDGHALLLNDLGAVRTDRDLVFFNAPRHVSQAVTLDQEPAPGTARLSVSLPRTETDVQRIVIAGSIDDATLREVTGLTLTVEAANGTVAQFEIDDTDSVAAMMFGEFYRRNGQWRFRAIGQGWASGLAGLVTEFGVNVEDPAQRTAARPLGSRSTNPFGWTHPPARSTVSSGRNHSATTVSRSMDAFDETHPAEPTYPLDEPRPPAPPADSFDEPRPPAHVGQSAGSFDLRRSDAARESEAAGRHEASNTSRPTARSAMPVDLERRRHTVEHAPPPPNPERADWHSDPNDSSKWRWWDGGEWTGATRPQRQPGPRDCTRCANPRRRKMFGGLAPCRVCEIEIEEFLTHWHTQAWRVLTMSGPRGEDWAALWASLRYQRIEAGAGREALREDALSYVERLVTFAFADGEVELAEFEAFEYAIAELALSGPLIEDLRRRMHRGRTLSALRAGELPMVRTPGLHLDPEEKVHVDLPAIHVRNLARGPKLTEGRLIASNKKLRFVGADTGIELPWSRVVSVHREQNTVVLAATSARGGAIFEVSDPDYVAAALEGALRVAKRLILTPGQRDTRSIPQEVKAEVWQRDGGKCVECGDGHYLEFDHIIPLSRGGATSATNLQILCRACNRAKGARI
ncbi:TerD family protein [Nocardia australiensis]|uniref:TerD family protein n=1 Tax=Nocardia australiensis TaxID=2887191 RepID=UPI001D14FC3C|nr:TerD family protein [Nocardia australiensis]